MLLLIIILLLVFGLGGLPTWGYHQYGYAPSSIVAVILVIVVIYLLLGHRF